jgi:hypothetical protein
VIPVVTFFSLWKRPLLSYRSAARPSSSRTLLLTTWKRTTMYACHCDAGCSSSIPRPSSSSRIRTTCSLPQNIYQVNGAPFVTGVSCHVRLSRGRCQLRSIQPCEAACSRQGGILQATSTSLAPAREGGGTPDPASEVMCNTMQGQQAHVWVYRVESAQKSMESWMEN